MFKQYWFNIYLVGAFLILFLTDVVSAISTDNDPNTLWVRTDGNDSCTGQNNISYAENATDCAWRTIAHALANVTAGQTVRVQSGRYYESKPTITHSGNSTAGEIKVVGDDYPILDGNNTFSVGFYALNNDYISISGFKVYDFTDVGIYLYLTLPKSNLTVSNNIINNSGNRSIWVRASGVYNVNVQNNILSHSHCASSVYGVIDAWRIHNSSISNNTISDSGGSGGKCVGILFGGNNTRVDNNNLSYNNDFHYSISGGVANAFGSYVRNNTIRGGNRGIRFDSGNSNNTVSGNTIMDVRGLLDGLNFYGGNTRFIVENNYLYNSSAMLGGAYGIIRNNVFNQSRTSAYALVWTKVDSSNVSHNVTSVLVENNTFIDYGYMVITYLENSIIRNNIFQNTLSGVMCDYYGTYPDPCNNITIQNNVFYNLSGRAIAIQNPGINSSNWVIKNNLFSNVSGYAIYNKKGENITAKYNLYVYNRSANWYGLASAGNDLFIDPLFANSSSGDFHLKSQYGRWTPSGYVYDLVTSPAINAGENGEELGAYGNTGEASMAGNTSYIDVMAYFYPNGGAVYSSSLVGKEKVELNALPFFGTVSVFANNFNGSFVNFTADTMDGNAVTFTATLKPNINYIVKKDGIDYATMQADSEGKIAFNNSVW